MKDVKVLRNLINAVSLKVWNTAQHFLQVTEFALCLVTHITVPLTGSSTASRARANISWQLTVLGIRSLSVSLTMLGALKLHRGRRQCALRYILH